jgi:hypothetical protein
VGYGGNVSLRISLVMEQNLIIYDDFHSITHQLAMLLNLHENYDEPCSTSFSLRLPWPAVLVVYISAQQF